MRRQRFEDHEAVTWHVPVAVEDIEEGGRHFDLAADSDVRARVARMAGLRDLRRLEANFDVIRRVSGGLHVTGRVSATVGQTCVVTLEPVANEVEEAVDLVFVPQSAMVRETVETEPKGEPREVNWNAPEPLVGGYVDLGALATESLILGLDIPIPVSPARFSYRRSRESLRPARSPISPNSKKEPGGR